MILYSQILDHAGPAFGIIMRHLRDNPAEGCMFHCTGTSFVCSVSRFTHSNVYYAAGKDRTGVFAALLLKVFRGCGRQKLSADLPSTVGWCS